MGNIFPKQKSTVQITSRNYHIFQLVSFFSYFFHHFPSLVLSNNQEPKATTQTLASTCLVAFHFLKKIIGKGPGLYTDIGKKARDLLYRDYQSDHKFSVSTCTSNGVAITSTGVKKGKLFSADVSTQLKNKNITTDVKVDTNSNLITTVTVDEPAPGLKTIFSFIVPDQRSGKVELQYQHEYAGISTGIGLTANPIVKLD